MTDVDPAQVAAIRERYRGLLLAWRGARSNARRANAIFDDHQAFYKTVRDTPESRQALRGLLDDPVATVRGVAATDLLPFGEDRALARAVLEALRDSWSEYSFDAKWTLIAYDEGSLDFDW
jgi:hypothetical protein